MVPVILRETDPGAPVLNGTDGSLYNVVKWALPQLGWTIEFDNGVDTIAFRNNPLTGSGYYLQIDDNSADHSRDARFARVRGFETMSALGVGTREFPTLQERAWAKSSTLDNTPREYYFIGTDTFFYFGTWNDRVDRSTGYRTYCAGDFIPYSANDPGTFMIASGRCPSLSDYSVSSGLAAAGIGYWASNETDFSVGNQLLYALAKSFDGTINGDSGYLICSTNTVSTNTSISHRNNGAHELGSTGDPDLITGSLPYSRLEIFAEASSGNLIFQRRGYLPGIVNPLNALTYNEYRQGISPYNNFDVLSGLNNGKQLADFALIWGNYYFGASNSTGGNFAYMIDITSDWENW